ncbi:MULTISPECIES: co-chaperone GroES [Desulfovibrio]|jgi:chaperonin GroES|uniref:co-chaperone GroES n=1 Tax=Desulfovibrio TaxID=872 RepID=UPI00042539B4|nr:MULTISPECIES: co-chaperone GroES [Desulfovibrio]MDY0306297.1 co-chaperone GroES [Desulfovibrionaceae bacterium]HMM39857.1 co-chaperone GroES [Desulfovibrio sp.]
MSLKPLHDRVLVQRLEGEEKTKGGIIIPDTAKEKPMQAKVVAVGPGKGKAKMTVKAGDMVLIGKYAGNEFKVDGKDLVILREEDILAVIEK